MGPGPLIDRIKDAISFAAFRVFLWSIDSTDEDYWDEVYQIEKARLEQLEGTTNDN